MIQKLFLKPGRYEEMVEVDRLVLSEEVGISGGASSSPLRHVLIVPVSTHEDFNTEPGSLRENMVIDDSALGPLHDFPSGTVLRSGSVQLRLTVHCEPCTRLRGIVSPAAIEHRRGYLCQVVAGGEITLGSALRAEDVQYEPIPYDLKERLAWFLEGRKDPIAVTELVLSVGLSLSYCRAIPRLLRHRPDLLERVSFRTGRHNRRKGVASEDINQSSLFAENGAALNHLGANRVALTSDAAVVYLRSGASFTVPFSSEPRLKSASEAERLAWKIREGGEVVCWPTLGFQLRCSDFLGLDE